MPLPWVRLGLREALNHGGYGVGEDVVAVGALDMLPGSHAQFVVVVDGLQPLLERAHAGARVVVSLDHRVAALDAGGRRAVAPRSQLPILSV